MQSQTDIQKQTLYNIRQDHYELIQMIEDADGEITPEIESAMQLNEESFKEKAVSYGYVIKGFEDTEKIIDQEIKRLSDLKSKAIKRQELFKTVLSEAMQQYRIEKIETPTIKLSFRKSEAVNITDESLVAFCYVEQKVVKSISKAKIKEDLKAGISVLGAELIIRQNLQIK